MNPTCKWFEDPNYECYDTDCEQAFIMIEGTPSDNGMKFCCYCGKPLVVVKYESVEDL